MLLSGLLSRVLANVIVIITLVFLLNNYLIFWLEWPGALTFLQHKQWFGFGPLRYRPRGWRSHSGLAAAS